MLLQGVKGRATEGQARHDSPTVYEVSGRVEHMEAGRRMVGARAGVKRNWGAAVPIGMKLQLRKASTFYTSAPTVNNADCTRKTFL